MIYWWNQCSRWYWVDTRYIIALHNSDSVMYWVYSWVYGSSISQASGVCQLRKSVWAQTLQAWGQLYIQLSYYPLHVKDCKFQAFIKLTRPWLSRSSRLSSRLLHKTGRTRRRNSFACSTGTVYPYVLLFYSIFAPMWTFWAICPFPISKYTQAASRRQQGDKTSWLIREVPLTSRCSWALVSSSSLATLWRSSFKWEKSTMTSQMERSLKRNWPEVELSPRQREWTFSRNSWCAVITSCRSFASPIFLPSASQAHSMA